MAFIFQEDLDGQVDGVNMVFSVINDILTISDIIFDGVPFIGSFTQTGNKEITLDKPPVKTLRVSYYNTI